MKKKDNHYLYYLSLFSLVFLGIFLTNYFSDDKNFQMISIVGISVSYAVIGIIHHLINHDLVSKIVIEYILIAGLGVAASFFIFRGGLGF